MDYGDLDDYTVYRAMDDGCPSATREMLRRYGPGLRELAVAAGMAISLDGDEKVLRSVARVIASHSIPAPAPRCLWSALVEAVEEVVRARGGDLADLQ